MYQSNGFNTLANRVTQSIVLAYQAIAVVIFVVSLFSAYAWLNNPFIGGFFEQTFVLNGSDTRVPGKHWFLYEQGFKLGDQLVSVNGLPIATARGLRDALATLKVGQTVPIVIRTLEGEARTVDVPLKPFPAADQISYFLIPAFLSLVFLILSLWIFGLRRTEPAGRAFSMMTTSLAIIIGSLFDLYTSHHFTYIWTLAVALSGGALIGLGLSFPQEARIVFGRPYLRWVGYAAGAVLAVSAFLKLYDFENPTAYIDAWRTIYIFVGLAGLFYFGALANRAFLSLSPVVKNQARAILIGALIAFVPVVFWYCIPRSEVVLIRQQTRFRLIHTCSSSLFSFHW